MKRFGGCKPLHEMFSGVFWDRSLASESRATRPLLLTIYEKIQTTLCI